MADRRPHRDDLDPDERDLSRRSGTPAVSLWLVITAILLLGGVVFVVSAVL